MNGIRKCQSETSLTMLVGLTSKENEDMVPTVSLRITKSVARSIRRGVRAAGEDECMGLLARRPDSAIITVAEFLEADASSTHAEACPEAIRRATEWLRSFGLVICGLFHSHGRFSCFHSATDRSTINTLLPALAETNFERPQPAITAPSVVGCDRALLPRRDGRFVEFTLRGEPIPGLDAFQRASWKSVNVSFHEEIASPCAVVQDGALVLVAGEATMMLALPPRATVSSRDVDLSPVRSARLYSLVTNLAGDYFAEALEITEFDGQNTHRLVSCAVQVLDDPPAEHGGRSDTGGAPRLLTFQAPRSVGLLQRILKFRTEEIAR